jgi:hypothetical protein
MPPRVPLADPESELDSDSDPDDGSAGSFDGMPEDVVEEHMEMMLHHMARRSPPPNVMLSSQNNEGRPANVEYEPGNVHDLVPNTTCSEKQKAAAAKMVEVFEKMHDAGSINEGTYVALMDGAQIVHNSVPAEIWGTERVRFMRMRETAMSLADKYATEREHRVAANNDAMAQMDQAAQYSSCMKDLYHMATQLKKENTQLRNPAGLRNKRIAEEDNKREDTFRKCRRIADKLGLQLGEEK